MDEEALTNYHLCVCIAVVPSNKRLSCKYARTEYVPLGHSKFSIWDVLRLHEDENLLEYGDGYLPEFSHATGKGGEQEKVV